MAALLGLVDLVEQGIAARMTMAETIHQYGPGSRSGRASLGFQLKIRAANGQMPWWTPSQSTTNASKRVRFPI
jgi:hypothetical protein